eukprot:m.305925 g.305925  ORF g.305925 m.305925 type:complete len:150 (+) comp15913_c0_seq3:439-888(+)
MTTSSSTGRAPLPLLSPAQSSLSKLARQGTMALDLIACHVHQTRTLHGQAERTACPTDTLSTPGSEACTLCQYGMELSTLDDTCVPCPAGTFTNALTSKCTPWTVCAVPFYQVTAGTCSSDIVCEECLGTVTASGLARVLLLAPYSVTK